MHLQSELPDELQTGGGEDASEKKEMEAGERAERLAQLGALIAQKRDEAVKARQESGIEYLWLQCEEAYLGIDDMNRAEFGKARWAKSTSMQGPLTTSEVKTPENKSTAYVRLTTRYVDMGAAKLSEIVLPIDDKAFEFGPTPVPDLIRQKDSKTPIRDASGSMIWRNAEESEMGSLIQGNPAAAFMGADQGMTPQVPVTQGDVAKAKMKQAKDAATKAETRVYDWMVEARYPMQMRKVIHDSARIGVGVLKGPFPESRTNKAFTVTKGVGKLDVQIKTSPGCKWIDPWNLFPAPNCGEDIHSGDHIFERDFLSSGGVKKLKLVRDQLGKPIYLADQIDKVIEEGPDKCNMTDLGRNPNQPVNKHRFEIWYYTGILNREDMMLLEATGADELPDEVLDVPAIVTMVNDSPIRATFNPLEKTGNFPYRTFPWTRRAGHWAGVGVGEQVSMPQRAVNASTRAWFNNAGLSSGIQIFLDQHKIVPADGNWDFTPNKIWWMTADGVTDDINKILKAIEFPDTGKNLLGLIEYAMRLAEEHTNIPLISQGQTGPNDPQTFGQAELQNGNANTLLRQLAYSLDDHVTEPLVNDFYEWLLLDPDIPDDEKDNFNINARGSIAMVEKAIQEQVWMNVLAASLNPAYEASPARAFEQMMLAKRLDPDKVKLTEEEKAKAASQPPPKAPQVQVAEINAARDVNLQDMRDKTAVQIAQGRDSTTLQKARVDTDRDTVYVNAERERTVAEQEGRYSELALKRELALIQYANDRQISLDDAKVDLAKEAMKLNAQIKLSNQSAHGPQVATPAFEPPGRAPDGQAFPK